MLRNEEDRYKMIVPRNLPARVYIRFGRWDVRSYNHHTGEREKGISVYPAKWENGAISLVADEFDFDSHTIECLAGRLIFPVTGKLHWERGSDGEPLLRQVKALGYPINIDSIPKEFRSIGRAQ